MAKRKSVSKAPANTIQNDVLEVNPIFKNGINEALLGSNGFNFGPGNNGSVGTQLSQVNTLFINNRWYLVSNMRQLLSQVYVEHGLIQTIVDVPVDDGFRGGIEIKTKQLDPDQITELNATMEEKGDIEAVAYGAKWNRLFGGGGVMIITGQDPSTPLDMSQITEDSQVEFRDVDMWELFWSKQNTSDYSAVIDGPDLNDVEFYDYYGVQVHKSRVIKMIGYKAPSFIRPRLRGWGVSVVESMIQSLNQYLKAKNLTFEVLDEFKVDVFKIKNFTNTLLSPLGDQKIRNRVALANQQKNYQNAITMDSEDDYIQKELSFAGISETMQGIRMQIASDMRMPLTKVFGISATGFSSGQDDIENYNAMVESQVRSKVKYGLLKVIKIRCQQMFGMVPDDLTVGFKPLRMLSAEQEENVKTQQFNRLLAAKTAGELSSLEFKDALNKANLLPIQVDTSVESLQDQVDQNDLEDKEKEVPVASPKSTIVPKDAPEVRNSLDSYLDFKGPKIVTVGLISGDEILTGKRRDNGLWTNPGGHMDAGEDIQEAAVREVLEETGILISKSQLTHVSSELINSHRTGKDFVVHCFTASINRKDGSNKLDPDKEFSELKWVKIHPSTPELRPEARHAKVDSVIVHLLSKFKNSLEYDVKSYEADGGADRWAPYKQRHVTNPDPKKINMSQLDQSKEASRKAFGKEVWQFILWHYQQHLGKKVE